MKEGMRILVIAPHPDDEAIGVGGVIALHIQRGDEVLVHYLTRGEKGCPGQNEEDTATLRIHEGFEASKVLGSKIVGYWEEPDGGLLSAESIHRRMAQLMAVHKPDRVYVTHFGEAHPDHQAAAEIVQQARYLSFLKPEIWEYEVWTPMAMYDEAVDITDVIGIKLRAIRRHESQVNRIRFDEAALCLARFRGELHNRPAGPYAEVLRKVP